MVANALSRKAASRGSLTLFLVGERPLALDVYSLANGFVRRYRSPIGWFNAFKVRPWGTDWLRDSMDKVKLIQERLLTAQGRQKSYADPEVRDLEFMVRELVLLKMYHSDGSHVIIWDLVLLDQNLTFEEESIAILDRQDLKLRLKEIASVKVQWRHLPIEDESRETDSDMRSRYLQLFEDTVLIAEKRTP
ncbi:uncharacterized protein LOC132613070 [Lycium barbarum]|uniref:uncharacterized protein LOC132613070 n=1 Tax=Lycium barbarum TaxID=112863 RepID=UPI00293E6E37|nr:uncharacterized protein LOC132613070 [Lycium barbarum]